MSNKTTVRIGGAGKVVGGFLLACVGGVYAGTPVGWIHMMTGIKYGHPLLIMGKGWETVFKGVGDMINGGDILGLPTKKDT